MYFRYISERIEYNWQGAGCRWHQNSARLVEKVCSYFHFESKKKRIDSSTGWAHLLAFHITQWPSTIPIISSITGSCLCCRPSYDSTLAWSIAACNTVLPQMLGGTMEAALGPMEEYLKTWRLAVHKMQSGAMEAAACVTEWLLTWSTWRVLQPHEWYLKPSWLFSRALHTHMFSVNTQPHMITRHKTHTKHPTTLTPYWNGNMYAHHGHCMSQQHVTVHGLRQCFYGVDIR